MNLRKRLLKNCRLYLVLDKDSAAKGDLVRIAKSAIKGGVDILQLRWKDKDINTMLKTGEKLKNIAGRSNVLFIIDDNPHLAKAIDADGVHLGQEDLVIKKARSILGPDKIIGYSTHNVSQAKRAVLEGADYISIGPVFKTSTKPNYKAVGLKILRRVTRQTRIPIFAIGGINLKNIKKVVKNGAQRVAVVRALVNAKNPEKAAGLLKEGLK